MKSTLKSEFIWISMNTTINENGRSICIVLVGALLKTANLEHLLICCKQVETVYNVVVAQVINFE